MNISNIRHDSSDLNLTREEAVQLLQLLDELGTKRGADFIEAIGQAIAEMDEAQQELDALRRQLRDLPPRVTALAWGIGVMSGQMMYVLEELKAHPDAPLGATYWRYSSGWSTVDTTTNPDALRQMLSWIASPYGQRVLSSKLA